MAGTCGVFDLSGLLAIPSSLKIIYQNYWGTFERIQKFDLNISTLRSFGDKTQTYYVFKGNDERLAFINGQYLHVQRYPNLNWNTVPKD